MNKILSSHNKFPIVLAARGFVDSLFLGVETSEYLNKVNLKLIEEMFQLFI